MIKFSQLAVLLGNNAEQISAPPLAVQSVSWEHRPCQKMVYQD
jgi:hypothetical protein